MSAPAATSFSHILPIVAIISTVVISIAGWMIVHFFSKNRDVKKEWRDQARARANDISRLISLSIKYHTDEQRCKENENSILSLFNELEIYIQLIEEKLKIECRIDKFKETVTSENFQTNKFKQLDIDDPQIKKIVHEGNTLRVTLLRAE